MNRANILMEIDQLLNKIQDQHNSLFQQQDKTPLVQLDLMMRHTSELYEKLNELRSFNAMPLKESKLESTVFEIAKDSIPETKTITAQLILDDDKDLMQSDFSMNDETALAEEKMVEEMIIPMEEKRAEIFKESHPAVEEKKNAEKPVQETMVKQQIKITAELFDEVATVAESFTGRKTLHDKMSGGKTERSVATHLQSKSLTDLKKSIGINERFVFVKELFEGDQQRYNKSIDLLNSFSAYEEARKHLHEELAAQMNWNMESKVFSDLSELIRRRFNS